MLFAALFAGAKIYVQCNFFSFSVSKIELISDYVSVYTNVGVL